MREIRNEKFSIRKYKLGASSVLLGTLIWGAGYASESAYASEQAEIENKTVQSDSKVVESEITPTEAKIDTQSENLKESQSNEFQKESSSLEGNDNVGKSVENKIAVKEEVVENTDISETAKTNNLANEHTNKKIVEQSQNTLTKKVSAQVQTSASVAQEKLPAKVTEGQSEQPANVQSDANDKRKKVTTDKTSDSPRINTAQAQSKPLSNKEDSESVSNTKGVDVTNKVSAKDDSQIISENVVNPHRGQRSQLKYNLAFEKGIKPGDYFDFMISNNVNTYGVSARKKVPDIKNGSIVMATGQLLDNGKIRYTFTDYIKDKVNVTAQLNLNLFIDPKVVQRDSQQTITSTLNGKTLSKEIYVQHLNGVNNAGVGVNGAIETIDKEQSKFSHIAYINTQGNTIQSATINGRITNGYTTNGVIPTVKVYEYIGRDNPPQSVYANTNDTSMWKDVTEEVKHMLQIGESQYQLHFDTLNKRYAIRYEGMYQSDAQNLNFQTNISGYPEHYPHYAAHATWNNGLVFYQNNANGNGETEIIENNDINWEEDTLPDGESGHNNGETEEEDSKPIDWEEGSASDGDSGHNNGETEEEDSKPIDWEEGSASDGDSGHNNGEAEEEDSKPIDWEEGSAPDGDSGQNNGETEEEDSKPIDWEERSASDGDSGQNNGETEEEDSKPIDWEERSASDGDSGHNNGETEEEDSKPIDWEEGSASDGDSGQNNGETEEEDSKPIDWEEGSASDGDSGHNNGETEEEDSKPIDWEEDTTPDGDNGHNNSETEEEDTKPIDDEKKPDEDKTPDDNEKPDDGKKRDEDNNRIIKPNGNSAHTKDIEVENISYQKVSNHKKVKMSNSNLHSDEKSPQQMKHANVEQVNELPATGEKLQHTTLFATLLALIGTTLLFNRKRKNAK
ncbi:fibrinogen-binding adhesin SdrG C-terminal domain-containing protein [Staphylococcus caeli]|uniref:Fibronectin-binding protein n=1 Tax=Staphylococcus caeli TaxID=2201815 RepID=A0A1D4HV93_9STAP|nr:fibrinogen-binding adhesin SdrG C-terminal domain-containing protein [Staphylococcus caeli]SCS41105.1 fibronectin-binding protein precursor [Staphylococcus caeli]SCS59589.1 fibronectin-binding protein precursor [Staphylococcus caeli]